MANLPSFSKSHSLLLWLNQVLVLLSSRFYGWLFTALYHFNHVIFYACFFFSCSFYCHIKNSVDNVNGEIAPVNWDNVQHCCWKLNFELFDWFEAILTPPTCLEPSLFTVSLHFSRDDICIFFPSAFVLKSKWQFELYIYTLKSAHLIH